MTHAADREVAEIARAGRLLSLRGWAPAGAGNYSHRMADGGLAITVSAARKAELDAASVMVLEMDGAPRDKRRPSAEAALHLLIYRRFPEVQAVLHTHSIPVVAISRMLGDAATLRLAGYELLKAFPGMETHECTIELPIVDNSQDMAALAATVAAALEGRPAPAFLIRDHGLYGWGRTMDEALCVVEAAETLIACELELMRLKR